MTKLGAFQTDANQCLDGGCFKKNNGEEIAFQGQGRGSIGSQAGPAAITWQHLAQSRPNPYASSRLAQQFACASPSTL